MGQLMNTWLSHTYQVYKKRRVGYFPTRLLMAIPEDDYLP